MIISVSACKVDKKIKIKQIIIGILFLYFSKFRYSAKKESENLCTLIKFQQVKCLTYLSPWYLRTISLNLLRSSLEVNCEKTYLSLFITANNNLAAKIRIQIHFIVYLIIKDYYSIISKNVLKTLTGH